MIGRRNRYWVARRWREVGCQKGLTLEGCSCKGFAQSRRREEWGGGDVVDPGRCQGIRNQSHEGKGRSASIVDGKRTKERGGRNGSILGQVRVRSLFVHSIFFLRSFLFSFFRSFFFRSSFYILFSSVFSPFFVFLN